MDKTWVKERIHKFLLLIKSRPFFMFILLIVVLSMILRIIAPCFLVLCSITLVTCLALGTENLLAFMLKTREFTCGLNRAKQSSSSSSDSSMHGGCDCGFDAPISSTTSWRRNLAQTAQRILRFLLDFVKRHVLVDIDEEGLLVEATNSTMPSKQEAGKTKKEELGKNACVCHTQGVSMVGAAGKAAHACANFPHDDGEAADVPELEDCSTSSEEEEVCKSILETSTLASDTLDDITFHDTMLQPNTKGVKAVMSCEEEDVNSIDKHQILPPEACNQCKNVQSKGFYAFDSSSKSCACDDTGRSLRKLDVTDAELQDAASEFYTLEGDVLWSEADLKKKPDCKKGSVDGMAPAACEICKHGMFPQPSENFCVLPSKACAGAKTFAHKPANTKIIYYVEAMRAQEENKGGVVAAHMEDMNEDVKIDQELRAIASRSGNKGDESNYMSTAGSFRDFVGSFREFDACWAAEYGLMGRREDDFVTGCCDDHARPCISHSRSRSKVLQSDPLLSKASLTREQEIMDVLWQEYNEDRRLRFSNLDKIQKDNAHKQRLKAGAAESSASTSEVLESEGNPAESTELQAHEYVMKLNNSAEYGTYDRYGADQCRLGCDKPCWHMAKARSYHRRRHFVGFCRLFRELGLKQCMQSSKVDN